MADAPVIDYYFAPMSGYAYLGHAALLEIAARAGAQIRYHPLNMLAVFAAAGSFPPAKYPQVRQTHRKADMARWAARRGLTLNPTPAFWPVPMPLACQVIAAAGADQGAATGAILSAVWEWDLNIADGADLIQALDRVGLDGARLVAAGDQAAAEAETKAAIEIGIFGSPTYALGDDWFFGQDRLSFLAEALGAPA